MNRSRDYYIIFDIFIKKYNKKFKLIWNKDEYFDDAKIINLFNLDNDKTVNSQIEILGAKIYGDIDEDYINYFNSKYQLEDYKALFETYYYKDYRCKSESVLEDITISFNCQIGYEKISNLYQNEWIVWYWYDNDIQFLEDELEYAISLDVKRNIMNILDLEDEKKIREEIEKKEISILENKKNGGFYYFYENQTLFRY